MKTKIFRATTATAMKTTASAKAAATVQASVKTTAAATVVALLAGCNFFEPIYDTPHPDHGRVTLTTDWSERGEDVEIPDAWHVRVNGDDATRQTFARASVELPDLFAPETHRLHLWHDAPGITMSGNVASVEAVILNRAAPRTVSADPGWFFSDAVGIEIEKDKVHELTVTMHQQVRRLTLVVEPTGDAAERVESISATLSGVAGTLDIDTHHHGSPSHVALDFTKGTDGKWTATMKLLGIAGAEQKLTGTIVFEDGTPLSIALESDLSTALVDFNADKKTPLTLGGTTAETPNGVDITATITDWNEVTEQIDIN
ncbi:MAG: FimB/Mfa2 family fimbrial subunit [Alistipes sp.]|nr:FimB/Mfa2 family fimbrial subunit [Alistipes sp.]